MIVKEPRYRKRLGKNQVELLGLICKFRFVTVPILSEWRHKDKSTIYERLLVLVQQGYLHKHYEKRWRLLGKPAVYSLSAKGVRVVREQLSGHFTEAVLRNQYKNSSASLQLVDHSVAVAKLCLQFKRQYSDTMQIFTKAELAKYEEFIRPLPDIYLRKREQKDGRYQHYQVEIIEAGMMSWLIRKRINAHQEWFEEQNGEGWVFEDDYPTLLLVCGNQSTERRVHRLIDEGYFDFDVLTTTSERFKSGGNEGIWLEYWDEEQVTLSKEPKKPI